MMEMVLSALGLHVMDQEQVTQSTDALHAATESLGERVQGIKDKLPAQRLSTRAADTVLLRAKRNRNAIEELLDATRIRDE